VKLSLASLLDCWREVDPCETFFGSVDCHSRVSVHCNSNNIRMTGNLYLCGFSVCSYCILFFVSLIFFLLIVNIRLLCF
jgi:hypothetical protein